MNPGKNFFSHLSIISIITLLAITVFFTNCGWQTTEKKAASKKNYSIFDKKYKKPKNLTQDATPEIKPEITKKPTISTVEQETKEIKTTDELDFIVENKTGKTIYVTCFSYIQKVEFTRWHWDKSEVYKIDPYEKARIDIDTIPDNEHRKDVFGYLGVFDDEQEAHDAIFELVPDTKKIDLDILYTLKEENKQVTIKIERYGIKEETLDFAITQIDRFEEEEFPELDFTVVNNTGKTIFVTGFVYQINDDEREVWSFDKTTVLKLDPNESGIINIDTIAQKRDRRYMHGYLGVFEENEEQQAHDSTYELLDSKKRITLGRLSKLKDKTVILEVEQYGVVGQITEYDITRPTPPKGLYPEKATQELL